MNIECKTSFRPVGFKANYAKVLRTPQSDAIIANAGPGMRAVVGEKVTDILFYDARTRFRTLERLKKIGATMIYPNRDVSEEGFNLRVRAGNTFSQKA